MARLRRKNVWLLLLADSFVISFGAYGAYLLRFDFQIPKSNFKFEKKVAQMNKGLSPKIETIFIVAPSEVAHISSSLVREIMKNDGDISPFVTFKKK